MTKNLTYFQCGGVQYSKGIDPTIKEIVYHEPINFIEFDNYGNIKVHKFDSTHYVDIKYNNGNTVRHFNIDFIEFKEEDNG